MWLRFLQVVYDCINCVQLTTPVVVVVLRAIHVQGDLKINKRPQHKHGRFIFKIVHKEGYEYADFYCYGLENKILNDAGFFLVNSIDDLIIPNYFSPYLQKNINLNFFVDTENLNLIKLFKGDGDQDRPS